MAARTKTTKSTKKPVKKVSKKPTKKAAQRSTREYKTLHVSKAKQPFLSFKFTRQTLYWTILVAFVIVMQLWILKAQNDVVQTTDQLQLQLQMNTPVTPAKVTPK